MTPVQDARRFDASALSLEQKVGQLVIARYPDWAMMEEYARRGVISGMTPQLTARTPEDAAEFLNVFQRESRFPLLFGWSGICYRGGTDLRLSQLMRIGATRSAELAYQAAKIEAVEARAVGFHLIATPNLDVNTRPENPIINLRSLGDDASLVIELGLALCRGALDGGGLNVLMHFPGHGASASDSHIAMPAISRTLEELTAVDMKPFRAAVEAGVAATICTNHCHYPALEPDREVPATVSRGTVTGILREQYGYDGIIISDSLTMRAMKHRYGIEESAVLTVQAGHDLILQDYESDPQITLDALVKAVESGRIPLAQIEDSLRRVTAAKARLGLFENRFTDPRRVASVLATEASRAVAQRIARESVTLLEDNGLPLPRGAEASCVVISNGSVATIEEDMGVAHVPPNEFLRQRLQRRMPRAESLVLSHEMRNDEVQRAFERAAQADCVVFGLFSRVRSYAEEGIRLEPAYEDLIRRLAQPGRRRVYLNFGNPWVTPTLPAPDVSLCAFSDAHDSIEASLQVLFGEIPARGRLPIRLSAQYPFGYGRGRA